VMHDAERGRQTVTAPLLRVRPSSVLIFLAMMPVMNCAGGTPAAERATSIRFAIELTADAEGPIYVLLSGADDQPGWIRASHAGARVYFKERCDIPDCGVDPAVCGAAIPLVRNLASSADERSIEFVWDLTTSVRDSVSGCETREAVPPGTYTARFCFSREAELQGQGDVTRGVMGRVVSPTCVDREFTLQEQQVVVRIPTDSS
jgi:hypothetical protein